MPCPRPRFAAAPDTAAAGLAPETTKGLVEPSVPSDLFSCSQSSPASPGQDLSQRDSAIDETNSDAGNGRFDFFPLALGLKKDLCPDGEESVKDKAGICKTAKRGFTDLQIDSSSLRIIDNLVARVCNGHFVQLSAKECSSASIVLCPLPRSGLLVEACSIAS